MSLNDGKSTSAEAAAASIEVSTTATSEPSSASALAAAAEGGVNGDGGASDETKLSKKQMKKLAKGKGKEKKEKPTWNQPGEGKKKKQNDDKAASSASPMPSLPKQAADFVNLTPKGHKKDLSTQPMADAYHPAAVEAAWQDWWEASGYYSCDPAFAAGKSDKEKFVMVIPPPNVTGSLHLGHALTAAVEDTLTRWHRMLGHATLYVPGE
jgi:valyl-tRNA synthetase